MYIGFSSQRVPSLSKVAIRSMGATNVSLYSAVTRSTKSRMARFASPSFQEGRRSVMVMASLVWCGLVRSGLLGAGDLLAQIALRGPRARATAAVPAQDERGAHGDDGAGKWSRHVDPVGVEVRADGVGTERAGRVHRGPG